MKSSFLLVLAFLFIGYSQAQSNGMNSLRGTVSDSISGLPLEYATITVFPKGEKKPLNGTVSDRNGLFVVNDLQEGSYTVLFEFIGYHTYRISTLQLSKSNPAVDLKEVLLSPQKNSLQTVTVVAQTKLLENKIDKMVFNAEKDITSKSGVATDVLKKIPQVSVDIDGNVQLSGSGGVRFLINGKPSTAFGSNIADVLQSIPASQIKSIEVITNPGAKYDAQGLGGIINIILKTSKTKGYNGNLSLTAGSRQENGSFNLNMRNNNFGMNAFVSGNKRLTAKTPSISERLTYDTNTVHSLLQDGSGSLERHGLQAGTGFDWTVKKVNNLSGAISYNNFGNLNNRYVRQTLQLDKGGSIPPVLSSINSTNRSAAQSMDASLVYRRTFAKDDQELELGVNTSTGKQNYRGSNEQRILPQDSVFYASNSNNPGKERETELYIDYTHPIKENVALGIGAKASFYQVSSESSVLAFDPVTHIYQPDSSLANNLDYHQKVYAIYTELNFPAASWLDVKLGGRYERTEIHSSYSNVSQPVKIPGYNTFVPSIYFSKKINEEQTIRLSYSKRIERPDYGDLNPFVNTNDPKNLSAGNSHLKPEIGHRMELSYNRNMGKSGSFMASLFYRINENDIQPYIQFYNVYQVGDSTYTNVAVTTRRNIGKEQNLGVNIFADVHTGSKLSLRTNLSFFRRHTINTIDHGYDYSSFNYRFNLNASYQFNKSLAGEFFGNFNSPRNEAQGKYPSFTTYSMALRKQFWNKKGSLALTANNFFSQYITQHTILSGPGFYTNSTRKIPFRSIGLNFSWRFGKLEFKKEKPETDNNLSNPE